MQDINEYKVLSKYTRKFLQVLSDQRDKSWAYMETAYWLIA
jgi:hypothetical protein